MKSCTIPGFPLLSLMACFTAGSLSFLVAQEASRFEKEVLSSGLSDPLQLDIAADGRIFFLSSGKAR